MRHNFQLSWLDTNAQCSVRAVVHYDLINIQVHLNTNIFIHSVCHQYVCGILNMRAHTMQMESPAQPSCLLLCSSTHFFHCSCLIFNHTLRLGNTVLLKSPILTDTA